MRHKNEATSQIEFDYEAEHSYYSKPVAEIRNYEWLDQDMRTWVPDYPNIFAKKTVLDIGAGEALQAMLVCERYQPKLWIGLELILNQMAAARSRLNELSSMGLVNGDTYHIPFLDSSFDLVFGNGVLHHLPNLTAITNEVRRVLREGGRYVGREPNFSNFIVRRRVLSGSHSANERVLSSFDIVSAFSESGFEVQIDYFWRRFPWVRWRFLATSMRILAWKKDLSETGN